MRLLTLVLLSVLTTAGYANSPQPETKSSQNETAPAALQKLWQPPGIDLQKRIHLWQQKPSRRSGNDSNSEANIQFAGKEQKDTTSIQEDHPKVTLEKMREILKVNPNLTPDDLLKKVREWKSSEIQMTEDSPDASS